MDADIGASCYSSIVSVDITGISVDITGTITVQVLSQMALIGRDVLNGRQHSVARGAYKYSILDHNASWRFVKGNVPPQKMAIVNNGKHSSYTSV